jgi:hypothetical protein
MRFRLSVLALALLIMAIGCKRDSGASSPSGKAEGDSKKLVIKPAEPTNMEPAEVKQLPPADAVVDAIAWRTEFRTDKAEAIKNYSGKTVEISGIVDAIVDDKDGVNGVVYLKADNQGLRGVPAHVKAQPWERVAVGSYVKIRGNLSAIEPSESLVSAKVVDPGPLPTIQSSVNLAKQFVSNPTGARQTFHNARRLIEGEIVDIETRDDSAGKFFLFSINGDSGVIVKCGLIGKSGALAQLEAAKPGQHARFFGTIMIPDDPAAKEIKVTGCALSEIK